MGILSLIIPDTNASFSDEGKNPTTGNQITMSNNTNNSNCDEQNSDHSLNEYRAAANETCLQSILPDYPVTVEQHDIRASGSEVYSIAYACQTGSKCRIVMFMYRVAIFTSKLHYIYPKCNIYVQNCDMYIQIRRPVFVLYITAKEFFDINISRTFLGIYFMRSVSHVSLHDLSRIPRA